MAMNCSVEATALPLIAVTTSRGLSPALLPGVPGWTSLICAPPVKLLVSETPTYACLIGCPPMIRLAIRATVFDGTAKPTPALEPEFVWIWSFRPSTCPSASSSGPPELPGLIAASVWMAFVIV